MNRHYFNEIDPVAAQWLRNLIDAGQIPAGDVDTRSIEEVQPDDLKGYVQCHFFAGAAGWPLALRFAGWPEDRPVWTGSCPCPPFSCAGKKKACPECGGKRAIACPRRTGYFICLACEHAWYADGRHLWPEFWRLIRDCRPATVIGEQVASADGRIWLAGVRATLERIGYAVGAADLAAASVGTESEVEIFDESIGEVVYRGKGLVGPPHIRQRLFWLANSEHSDARYRGESGEGWSRIGRDRSPIDCIAGRLSHSECERRERRQGAEDRMQRDGQDAGRIEGHNGPVGARQADDRRLAIPGASERGRRSESGREHGGALHIADGGAVDGMGDSVLSRLEGYAGNGDNGNQSGRIGTESARSVAKAGATCGVSDSSRRGFGIDGSASGRSGYTDECGGFDGMGITDSSGCTPGKPASSSNGFGHPIVASGHWSHSAIIPCADGKYRRVPAAAQPEVLGVAHGFSAHLERPCPDRFPLANKTPGRAGKLKGYGNAIIPQVAAEFVAAFMETEVAS